jgi:hypothetical protein
MYSPKKLKINFKEPRMPMNHWWCMDCRLAVNLDRHGRCGSCESEAVHTLNPENGQAISASVSIASAAISNSVSCS